MSGWLVRVGKSVGAALTRRGDETERAGGSIASIQPCQKKCPTTNGVNAAAFRVIERECDLLELRPQWEALVALQADHILEQRFHHAWCAWETVHRQKGRKLHVIVGDTDGRLVFVLPLVAERIGFLRVAHFLGPDIYENCDYLADPRKVNDDTAAQAWTMVAEHFDIVRFPSVRESAGLWRLSKSARFMRSTPIKAPFVDCTAWPGWEAYYRSRSQKFRQDARKSARRLERRGVPRLEVVTDREEADLVLSWMMARKAEWLERTGGGRKAVAAFLSKAPFYRRLSGELHDTGELVVIQLTVDGVRVAAQLGFRIKDRLVGQMIAWDCGWRECGPGRVLATATLRWGFENGAKTVDLGLGDEDYKYRLAEDDEPAEIHVSAAFGARGALVLSAYGQIGNMARWLSRSWTGRAPWGRGVDSIAGVPTGR